MSVPGFKKFFKGIMLRGETADPTDNLEGSLWYNSTDDRLRTYAESATRTVVTTDQAQVITNKDIDGGVAANNRRLTIPSGTLAALNALTRKEGTIVYATDVDTLYIDDGISLTALAVGGGTPITAQDQGSTITANMNLINFTGDGVTASSGGGQSVVVNIPGAPPPNAPDLLENAGFTVSSTVSGWTIDLKQADGTTNPDSNNPVTVAFFNGSTNVASYELVSVVSSLNMLIPDGATLGHSSGVDYAVWVYLLNNAGTVEMAVSSVKLPEDSLYTTVAIDTASDSNNVLYSLVARTDVPIRLIAKAVSNQAVAGIWSAPPVSTFSGTAVPDREDIIARYKLVTTQGFGSTAVVNFDSRDIDTHNAVTTGAGWRFTAPISGSYQINATLRTNTQATITAPASLIGFLRKNGSAATIIYMIQHAVGTTTTAGIPMVGSGSITIPLVAGDYVELLCNLSGVSNTNLLNSNGTLGDSNFISITRLGN